MLHLRVLSALVGIPLILFVVWQGGLLLLLFVGGVLILGLLEILNLLSKLKLKPNLFLTVLGSLMLLVSAYMESWNWVGITLTIMLITHLLLMLKRYPEYTLTDGAAGLFATLYLSLFIYVYLINLLPDGYHWLYLLIFGTWASDTFAYFCGRMLGKHKLTPVLSPNKTWEGAIGGLIGSVATVYLYSFIFKPLPLVQLVMLGLLISFSSQIGDLVESTLKRQANIKDSGNIIPGHGGILDRFDSMLLSAPMVYYFVLMFII